jgi:glycosyltransferase involved in cell wall biosynthesis
MNNQLLTIAIPTYNRPEQLRHTLGIILPQLVAEKRVRLLICDNHSEIPAQQIFEALNVEIESERVQIIQNKVNIGANANIMRCFEMCETTWLWVLGDDDFPSEKAIATILNDITKDFCYSFYTVPFIQKPIFSSDEGNQLIGTGFEALLKRFGNDLELIAFLSAAVFKMSVIRPYLINGYLVANTGTPHLMMMFKAVMEGHSWMISRDVIADYNPPPPGKGWGFMSIAFAVPCLLGMASSCEEIRIIRECMIKGWRISPKKILYSLVYKYGGNNSSEIRYMFDLIRHIYAPDWKKDFMLRLRWHLTAIWAHFPNFFANWYKKKKEGKARIVLVNDERC